jgi:hypothetical protein
MFCSACGQPLLPGQPGCPQCGRPATPVVPPVPGLQFQVESYAGKINALSIVWFIFAGFSILYGFTGMAFARAFFANHFGGWDHGPWSNGPGPQWFGPVLMHLIWVKIMVRTTLAVITAWGLIERARWARIFAIVVAFLSLFSIPPFGTALGIWTLVVLLGFRNQMLYQQIEQV